MLVCRQFEIHISCAIIIEKKYTSVCERKKEREKKLWCRVVECRTYFRKHRLLHINDNPVFHQTVFVFSINKIRMYDLVEAPYSACSQRIPYICIFALSLSLSIYPTHSRGHTHLHMIYTHTHTLTADRNCMSKTVLRVFTISKIQWKLKLYRSGK